LLKREPESAGLFHHLDRLRRETHSKIEFLGRLRYSPKGKAKKVRVKGLLFHFGVAQAYKLPLLGYLVRLATAMIRLPTIVGSQAQFEQYVAAIYLQFRENDKHCQADSATCRAMTSRDLRTTCGKLLSLEGKMADRVLSGLDLPV